MADEIDENPVGKGMPPTNTRFKSGTSGNPKGRRKGRKNWKTIVKQVAYEEHDFVVGGERTKRNTIEWVFIRLQQRALGGDLEAKKYLDTLRDRYEPEEIAPSLVGILIPPTLSIEDWTVQALAQRERMLWVQANRE